MRLESINCPSSRTFTLRAKKKKSQLHRIVSPSTTTAHCHLLRWRRTSSHSATQMWSHQPHMSKNLSWTPQLGHHKKAQSQKRLRKNLKVTQLLVAKLPASISQHNWTDWSKEKMNPHRASHFELKICLKARRNWLSATVLRYLKTWKACLLSNLIRIL